MDKSALPEVLVSPDLLESSDRPETMAAPEQLERLDRMAKLGQSERRDILDKQDPKDPRDSRAHEVCVAQLGLPDLVEELDRLDQGEQLARVEIRVLLDCRVQSGLSVQLGLRGLQD